MRSILAVLLENEPGALSRVVGLFAQRNYNIESLTVAPTEDPTLSRLTLTTSGDQQTITQIMKQLDKLVEVVRVVDLCEGDHVERELLLIKVRAEGPASHCADQEAARQAGRSGSSGRPVQGRSRRTGAAVDQGSRGRRRQIRDQALCGYFSGTDRRCNGADLYDSVGRSQRQTRRLRQRN